MIFSFVGLVFFWFFRFLSYYFFYLKKVRMHSYSRPIFKIIMVIIIINVLFMYKDFIFITYNLLF